MRGGDIEKTIIASEPRAPWPYAQAVRITGGSLIVCSGQVAFNPQRDIVGKGDIRAQTRQAFENLSALLEKSGASLKDVVHLTVYLTEMREFPRLGEIAKEWLEEPYPGMTLIGVKELAWPDLMVELQALAAIE